MALLRRWAREETLPLKDVLRGADLPTFPRVATAALERLGQPEVELREVGDILIADPGLSARLLRMVNSAAVGTRRHIESVHQAVTLLGASQLESTLIAAGVQEALPNQPVNGHDPRQFWHAAAKRATIASAFAQRVVPSMKSETFTAALLQDMAVPLLASARSDYGELLQDWRDGKNELVVLEDDAFGSDHATIAAQMCEEWGFPPSLRTAIESHHDGPGTSENGTPFVQLVAILRDTDDEADRDRLVELAAASLELHPDDTVELICEAETAAADLTALLT